MWINIRLPINPYASGSYRTIKPRQMCKLILKKTSKIKINKIKFCDIILLERSILTMYRNRACYFCKTSINLLLRATGDWILLLFFLYSNSREALFAQLPGILFTFLSWWEHTIYIFYMSVFNTHKPSVVLLCINAIISTNKN